MKQKLFHNYIVYETGIIKSLLTNKFIAKRIGPKGYYMVNLCINGKCKTYTLHRLLATLFIDNPNNLPFVNHIDGNKLNNSLNNLEWVTAQYNVQHAIDNHLINFAKGSKTKFGKFTEVDIKNIRKMYKNKISQYKIACLYNVTRGAIQQIVEHKTYTWVI